MVATRADVYLPCDQCGESVIKLHTCTCQADLCSLCIEEHVSEQRAAADGEKCCWTCEDAERAYNEA